MSGLYVYDDGTIAGVTHTATCKHCDLTIEIRPDRSKSWVHSEGDQAGKHTCAVDPYGFHAEPVGTPCSDFPANPCNGSKGFTVRTNT